jgi:hypothetical protein
MDNSIVGFSVSSLFTPCGMKKINYGITYIEENLVNMIPLAQEILPPDQKIQFFTFPEL